MYEFVTALSDVNVPQWMFSFEHMDDIRDDIALATVNSPRKVFTKQKSSQPRSFSRMPLNESASSKDFEDEDERKREYLSKINVSSCIVSSCILCFSIFPYDSLLV